MKLNELLETDLFKELSDQEQEVVAGGETWTAEVLQSFLNGVFAELGRNYVPFDYWGFFGNLQQNGWLDNSSPGGSNSTVPGSPNWRG